MDDFKDDVMIALLPMTDDWCKLKLPHMTLVYAGEVKDLKASDFNTLAKEASSIAALASTFTLRVTGKETFGDETHRVDVLTLRSTPELVAMRHMVESWNASSHKEFHPHCTIGPEGSFIEFVPTHLAFNRIMVAWGDEQLTFWLRGGYS